MNDITNTLIMLDTCSIMNFSFGKFIDRIAPKIRASGKKLIVPAIVLNELEKLSSKSEDLFRQVEAAMHVLMKAKDADILEIRYDAGDAYFADPVFLINVLRFSLKMDVAVVTFDRALTNDLLSLNKLESVLHKRVCVYKFNDEGELLECY